MVCKPVYSHGLQASSPENSPLFNNPILYKQVVGSLQYFTFIRPDITFAINWVCQHMQNHANFILLKLRGYFYMGTLDSFLLPILIFSNRLIRMLTNFEEINNNRILHICWSKFYLLVLQEATYGFLDPALKLKTAQWQ